MKAKAYLKVLVCAASVAGCAASIPPSELMDARQACAHASATPATLMVPAEMRKAQEALARAEKSFLGSPDSYQTRELASQAYHLAKRAEMLAKAASDSAIAVKADRAYDAVRTEELKSPGGNHAAQEYTARIGVDQQIAGDRPGPDASQPVTDLKRDLSRLAAVSEESRGLVCTLSSDFLFVLNSSKLTSASQHILGQLAQVLMASKEKNLTIEGHTDSRGTLTQNRVQSQERADAVRAYIITCGYPGYLIMAEGRGRDRPVAVNTSAGGRAKNRRVEIVISRGSR
jgi:outer membrane protein OmpA-like peptidoglycan-associated protein